MDWMLMPLRRYADFSGRSRRKEYWMFVLFTWLLFMAVGAVIGAIALLLYLMDLSEDAMMTVLIPLYMIACLASLALIIPSLAVQVRRLHDQDKSGWMLLLGFVPIVGSIIVLVFMCLEGTRGPNRFGTDPKGEAGPSGVFS